jgi:hypothetical protein
MTGTHSDIECLDAIAGSCAQGDQLGSGVGDANLRILRSELTPKLYFESYLKVTIRILLLKDNA